MRPYASLRVLYASPALIYHRPAAWNGDADLHRGSFRRTPLPGSRKTHSLALVALGFLFMNFAGAQEPPRNRGGLDDAVPIPTLTQGDNQQTSAPAINELQLYTKKMGLTAWHGMQATGTVTYGNLADSFPATLLMLPGNKIRMVLTSAQGNTIASTSGYSGHMQQAGGKDAGLSSIATAAGIIPFDLPSLASLSASGFRIVDRGMLVLEDESLHRVTIQMALQIRDAGAGADRYSVTDFYFDSKTHLLRKSASSALVPGAGQHRFLRVLTYGDYKTSGDVLVPTLISETLDGRATWSLHLDTVDAVTPPAATAIF